VEKGDAIFGINLVVVMKRNAICEMVKTEFGVASVQNAFSKRLGQLRDRRK
jgi:hypothetical protein